MFVIEVPSTKAGQKHTVRKAGDVWVCSCKDHVYRSKGEPYTCKHVALVAKSLAAHVAQSSLSDSAADVLAS